VFRAKVMVRIRVVVDASIMVEPGCGHKARVRDVVDARVMVEPGCGHKARVFIFF
jgi:hypothetical protein